MLTRWVGDGILKLSMTCGRVLKRRVALLLAVEVSSLRAGALRLDLLLSILLLNLRGLLLGPSTAG